MRKTIYILIFLGIGINFCFSQTKSEKRFGLTEFDAKKHDRIYRVQIEDYQNVELIDYLLKNNIKVHIIEYGIDQKKNKYNSVFIKSSQYPIKFINSYIETLNDSNIFFINCNLVMKIDLINYLNNYLNNYKGCDLLIPFTFKNIQSKFSSRKMDQHNRITI